MPITYRASNAKELERQLGATQTPAWAIRALAPWPIMWYSGLGVAGQQRSALLMEGSFFVLQSSERRAAQWLHTLTSFRLVFSLLVLSASL